jgi:serine/threonine protein phosphatase 1
MVWKRLFGSKTEVEPRLWHAPEGQRLYAIGDVHGRLDLLNELLAKIAADDGSRPPASTHVILLGDLVDRGPDSRGVVERVMELADLGGQLHLIGGNHEELMIRTWEGDKRSAGLFNRVGGRETLLSYGVDEIEYESADLAEMTMLAARHVPEAHIRFLKSFQDHLEFGDYLFVHAGVRPGYALEEQERSDMRWIRREFTEYDGDFGHMVIHGHTIVDEIDERPNRIGLDTGAFASGRLSAIGIEGSDRWFLQT